MGKCADIHNEDKNDENQYGDEFKDSPVLLQQLALLLLTRFNDVAGALALLRRSCDETDRGRHDAHGWMLLGKVHMATTSTTSLVTESLNPVIDGSKLHAPRYREAFRAFEEVSYQVKACD